MKVTLVGAGYVGRVAGACLSELSNNVVAWTATLSAWRCCAQASTILTFVPPGFELAEGIADGKRIRMGQALLRRLPA